MNRNLKGEILTTEELCEMMVEHKLATPAQLEALKAARQKAFHSDLRDRTRELRFRLWGEGKLILNCRTERNTPAHW